MKNGVVSLTLYCYDISLLKTKGATSEKAIPH